MCKKYIDPMTGKEFSPGPYKDFIDEAPKISLSEQIRDLIIFKFGSLKAFCDQAGMNYSTVHNILHRGSLGGASVNSVIVICDWLNIDFDALARGIVLPKDDKYSYQNEQPAPISESELDVKLIDMLVSLQPDELAMVDAFVQGLIAARKA